MLGHPGNLESIWDNKPTLVTDYSNDLLELLESATVNIDFQGKIISWNRGAERIFGYSPEEILGKNYFKRIVPANRIDEVKQIMSIIESEGTFKNYRTTRKRKDGTEFPADINIVAFRDKDGKFAGASCSIIDLFERNRIICRIQRTEKMAMLGQVVGGVAHDLTNPLTCILWNAENLREVISGRDDLEGSVNEIIQDVEYTTKITRNILGYARSKEPDFKEISMDQIVENALRMLSLKMRGLKINKDFSALVPIRGDCNQILQVIINIIDNALDAIPRDGQIDIKFENPCGYLTVTFQDYGKGIPRENIKKIFDPFFSTKEPEKGTGLGLSISKEIINHHGGFIKVESEFGQGTKIILGFPEGD